MPVDAAWQRMSSAGVPRFSLQEEGWWAWIDEGLILCGLLHQHLIDSAGGYYSSTPRLISAHLSWYERHGCGFIVALSAPRWVCFNAIWYCCSPSHSFMSLGSVVIIIAHKSIIAGWSLTGLGSACAEVMLFVLCEMVFWLQRMSGACRGIAALGPCKLGRAADLVIIAPIKARLVKSAAQESLANL